MESAVSHQWGPQLSLQVQKHGPKRCSLRTIATPVGCVRYKHAAMCVLSCAHSETSANLLDVTKGTAVALLSMLSVRTNH